MKHRKNSADVPGRAETCEPWEIALNASRYADDDTIIQPMVLSLVATEQTECDPYNSAGLEASAVETSNLDTSASWNLHSRYKRTF
ncbi:MAG: hypothetical protein IIA07_12200 [Proteobacteria bacterium]|nr:hypothetical protein [Pseudomonadota bacterium]